MTPPDACPLCGADLTGEPIPEEHRELYYGGRTHYSRKISVYDPTPARQDTTPSLLNRAVGYQCPDCSGTWPREGQ